MGYLFWQLDHGGRRPHPSFLDQCCHVCDSTLDSRLWNSLLHYCRVFAHGRARIPQRTPYHDLPLQRPLLRWCARCRGRIVWHTTSEFGLGMANTLTAASWTIYAPDRLHLVGSPRTVWLWTSLVHNKLTRNSFIPESPRFLIAKDKRDEAYQILVHYHAEGNSQSDFALAEMAQIESTIRLELQYSQSSWSDMISTPGMRKRVLVGSFLGLFTQWSGNTLISYYLSDLLKLIGYDDPNFKGKLNVGLNSWNLVNAVAISLLVRRFPRRVMYLTCATSLLCCYVGWTVAMQQFLDRHTQVAAKITIFFIFAYQPCYNIGYNALTYSKSHNLMARLKLTSCSFPRRTVPLRPTRPRHNHLPVLWPRRRLLYNLRQPHRPQRNKLALANHLLLLARLRNRLHRTATPSVPPSPQPTNTPQYFMFPETYGRTLEELAFLFETDARAEEVRQRVEKQLQHELGDFDFDFDKASVNRRSDTPLVPRAQVRTTITAGGRDRVIDEPWETGGWAGDDHSRWP